MQAHIAVVAAQDVIRCGLVSVLSQRRQEGPVEGFAEMPPLDRFDAALVHEDLLAPDPGTTLLRLNEKHPACAVLPVVATRDGRRLITLAEECPLGYASLDETGHELLAGVARALRRERHLPAPAVAALAASALAKARAPTLTGRELEVMRLAAQGATAKAIANELFISDSTVKGHLHEVYGKLGVSNRVGALVQLAALGLVALDGILS